MAQGQRGQRVGGVVQAGERQLVGAQQAIVALHQPAFGEAEVVRALRRIQAESQPPRDGAGHCHDARVLAVEHLRTAAPSKMRALAAA
jgi:hypothetical protein